jgi:RNA polymerase sigma-70 factor (ECF subfamily)
VEIELVERARAGDRAAFEAIAVAIADRLMAIAYGILRDRDVAEDAVQSTIVAIWRELPQLRESDRFDAWANRILVRTCQTSHRQARRHAAAIRLLPVEATTADLLRGVVARDTLERAFRHLPIEQRVVLIYRFYLDLPVDRIAGELGISAGTVKSRLHYAISAMRAGIDADARVVTSGEATA